MVDTYSSQTKKRDAANLIPWSSNIKNFPKQYSRYSRVNSKKQLALAYKSIPKESILSRRKIGNRRTNNSRKAKMPPWFKDNHQDDEALCLLLKQFNSQSEAKLPTLRPYIMQRSQSKFKSIDKGISKPVRLLLYDSNFTQWHVLYQ